MKDIRLKIFSALLLLSFFMLPATSFAANPSIGTSETVANVVAGTDDQTDVTSATTANVTAGTNDQTDVTTLTTANVAEVKATRTITAATVPAEPITLTIGTCVITITNAPASDTDCANDTAAIATSTDTTTSAIASRIRTITNLSDTGHGALTIGGSDTTASFTTTNTETSATVITASLSAGTDFTLTTVNTTGVIPVVQVNTITIAGTVDTGDVFTATLPTVGAVTYTVLSSDTTTANIATGLNAAIQASSGYAEQAFTSAASTNTVVLTAKVAGTGFTQTSSAANRAAVVQVNTITIAGTVDTGDVFTATLPTVGAVTYTVLSSDTTTANIATGLNAAIQASSGYAEQAFTSAASTNTVVLTAKVAGTGFTQTSSAANRAAVAQAVVFTPANLASGWTLTITINGSGYSYAQTSSDSTQSVVEALQALVDGSSAVSCTEDNTAITCTASSAGTSFTYATSVAAPPSSSGGFSASSRVKNLVDMGNCKLAYEVMNQYSSGTAGQRQYYQQKCGTTAIQQPVVVSTPSAIISAVFARRLTPGMTGDDVKFLQQLLNKSADTQVASIGVGSSGNETTYFGPLTEKAVQKFQIKHGIVTSGTVQTTGFGSVGPKTRAKLQEVFK